MASTFLFLFVLGVTVIFSCSDSAADNRPLVTLITELPGPTAPEKWQWVSKTQNVGTGIPDNDSAGTASDFVTTDISNGRCENIFDLGFMANVNPQRAADLIITLSTISQDGNTILKTREVFNGPSQAAGLSAAAANNITLATNEYYDHDLGLLPIANFLLNPTADDGTSNNCGRWRLTVSDVAKGNVSTWNDWKLFRRVAWYPYVHASNSSWLAARQYYADLLFGGKSTRLNLAEYFREVSRGKFTLYNAGIYGPVVWSNRLKNKFSCEGHNELKSSDVCPDNFHVQDIVHMLEEAGFDFRQFDKNHDGTITGDELAILAIDNTGTVGGSNRGDESDQRGCVALSRPPLFKVCASMVLVQQQVSFETLIHEFSHLSIGAVDLYDEHHNCPSAGLTPMSCTIGAPDEMKTVYLDPWHRIKAGWIFPYTPGFIFASNSYEMGDETWEDFWGTKSRPTWFRKADDPHEYFLFEYRGGRGYDSDVAAWGLIAWHVKEEANGNAFRDLMVIY